MIDAATYARLERIEAQAHRVIKSIEGAKPSGGAGLWIELWELRALLLDCDSLALPRPGGVA